MLLKTSQFLQSFIPFLACLLHFSFHLLQRYLHFFFSWKTSRRIHLLHRNINMTQQQQVQFKITNWIATMLLKIIAKRGSSMYKPMNEKYTKYKLSQLLPISKKVQHIFLWKKKDHLVQTTKMLFWSIWHIWWDFVCWSLLAHSQCNLHFIFLSLRQRRWYKIRFRDPKLQNRKNNK